MSNVSEFDDGSSSRKKKKSAIPKCKGCVCEALTQLANQKAESGQLKRLFIVNKGTSSPLSLDGTGNPTVFTLVGFDSETGCFEFSYEDDMNSTTPYVSATGSFIAGGHSIAGITILPNDFI
ncbi:hypothetical protein ELQ35_10395 [Peribacillus cavernae]|uniref:Uncharacterized protein n=1 Tax=Peribacillus cavernae TaxID=1674310 RepID=A0A3S0VZ96_9BACI|nr:hypothetical protein [Peribacillus cavernae]MDQ0218924.1 hypothetical protein [Peribacillus cavernae]RUQ29363.1 hypothetical protein ELQ35_10395 [Peribacillus cavernae]